MKTAISIDDALFQQAENLRKTLGVTRSRLFAEGITLILEKQKNEALTQAFNNVYSVEDSTIDTALEVAQIEILEQEQW